MRIPLRMYLANDSDETAAREAALAEARHRELVAHFRANPDRLLAVMDEARVLGPWRRTAADQWMRRCVRSGVGGHSLAIWVSEEREIIDGRARGASLGWSWAGLWNIGQSPPGVLLPVDEAKAQADARLRELGYALAEGP